MTVCRDFTTESRPRLNCAAEAAGRVFVKARAYLGDGALDRARVALDAAAIIGSGG